MIYTKHSSMAKKHNNVNSKMIFQDYYVESDYEYVTSKLPDIIKDAARKAGELIEPTIHERIKVMNDIRQFIKEKGRKVYGGTAINEAIKAVEPEDAIYDDYNFSDIEIYSPTPRVDLVEMVNMLYEKGYKHPSGSEAQHDETYSIFVNFQLYCDITYVPLHIYNSIKTIEIDGIKYTHPHFIFIDQLRIINQPLTAAEFKWEKTFHRMYKLLKNYPLEYYNIPIRMPEPPVECSKLMNAIKRTFLSDKFNQETCLISGFDAYNFFIKHAIQDKSVEQMARQSYGSAKIASYIVKVPYMEIISVNFRETVERIYNFIRSTAPDKSQVTMEEYFPLFQFTGYSVIILYNKNPVVKVIEADGFCIPNIKTRNGYMYVSFQYTMMIILINQFRSYLNKDRVMYKNYKIALSNLVSARNEYLNRNKLEVINNTVFGEFKVGCIGSTSSYSHESRVRQLENFKQGKRRFRYLPDEFFAQSKEAQEKFDPSKFNFKNTSGNQIFNESNKLFKIDSDGNIIKYENVNVFDDPDTDDDTVVSVDLDDSSSESSSDDTLSRPHIDKSTVVLDEDSLSEIDL